MCGICGIYNERNEGLVTDMLDSIRHRGPDSFNTLLFANHSLGECGLNIVSTHPAVYPQVDKQANVALLFNGEIYNYKDIQRDILREGHASAPMADSDVILPLYARYGEDFARSLKGMFAIAIVEEDRIVLVRDKFGIKPLYYCRRGDRLIFGSEIKALLRHPEVPADLDSDALDEILVFGYIFSPERTLFRHVRQVPPGAVLTFDGHRFTTHSYYSIPQPFYANGSGLEYRDAVELVRGALLKTFGVLHNHDTHPKGIYLSGGLDSTLMAVLTREVSGAPIKTYTLYDSLDAPDLISAREVARAIGSEHTEVFVEPADYLKELPHFAYHYENLVAGGVFDIQGGMAFQILSRHISARHKVTFTGEGADELFGGYYWIYTHPLGFSDRVRGRATLLRPGSEARSIVEGIFPQPEDEKLYRKNLFDILMKSGLSNYHLWSVDRSCSSFGFEARPPFLYDDLADLALTFPIEFKVPDGTTTKRILKDAALPFLEKHGLTSVINRKKYGMPAALDHIRAKVQERIDSIVPPRALSTHPFRQYLRTPTDVLMFDLFYHVLIDQRGRYDSSFSIPDFYESSANERMYSI